MLIISTLTLKVILAFIITIMLINTGNNFEKYEANKNKTEIISNQPVAPTLHKHLSWLQKCVL